MDEAEMASVVARHQLEDHARLAVSAGAEHDAFIDPLHANPLASSPGMSRRTDSLRAPDRFLIVATAPVASERSAIYLGVRSTVFHRLLNPLAAGTLLSS
jgi:hypothetical protein